MYNTLADVRADNINFFSRGAMRFFNSKIESTLLKGKFFITSERMELDMPKEYTIREAIGFNTIDTVGEFQGFKSKQDAKDMIKELA